MTPPETEDEIRRLRQKLGLRNGLFVGAALALGFLAPQAITLSAAHVRGLYPTLLLGFLALVLLGGLAGWLAAWRESALWGALTWFLASGLMVWTAGHLPYEVRSATIWLAEPRLWGLPIYPFSAAARARLLMAAFFVVLCLTILGLLQSYRLEGIAAETEDTGRMSARAWFLLLIPLPLVFAAGLAADNLITSPERTALKLVYEAIHTGRTYPGDLFELSLKRGVNYNAIAGVRDEMSANYSLSTADVSLGASNTVLVVAHFDNGAWINCRVTADQLFHCADASPPYRQGFAALLTEGETPEDCRVCTIKVSEGQRDWLLARREKWQGSPDVTRLSQWGSYVWMRARSPGGDYGVECLFRNVSPVTLDHCREIGETD